MDELKEKVSELLKSLLSLKEQQDFFVPALKTPTLKTPSATAAKPKPLGADMKPPDMSKIPGGLPPPSKKDPVKVAEQLKNPRPQKAPTAPAEVVKFEKNGQWSLEKADATNPIRPPKMAAPAMKPVAPAGTAATNTNFTATAPSAKPKPELTGSQANSVMAPGETFPSFNYHAPTAVTNHPGGAGTKLTGSVPAAVEGTAGSNARRARKEAALKTPVSATEHGWGHAHSPEQNQLIDGLTLHDAKQVSKGRQGAAFARSGKHADEAVVKNSLHHEDREIRGHTKNNFNSARREVLYHNLARDFFGMGKHVPTTAGFTHNGADWSAQKKVSNASHPDVNDDGSMKNAKHHEALKRMHNDGTLDKLTLMDHLMGHHDRHGGNMMLDNDGNNLHLIDNGTAFDYGNMDAHPSPKYRRLAKDLGFDKDGHDMKQLHPEAAKWFASLDPEQAMKHFEAHGHKEDSPAIRGFRDRFNGLKAKLGHYGKHFAKKYNHSDDMFNENRLETHQDD